MFRSSLALGNVEHADPLRTSWVSEFGDGKAALEQPPPSLPLSCCAAHLLRGVELNGARHRSSVPFSNGSV